MTTIESPITLTHYILNSQQDHPEASGDFTILFHAFEIASKYVSSQVRAAGILDLYGAHGSSNTSGDQVKKLDVLANEAFKVSLSRCKKVSVMASEEDTDVIILSNGGNYVAVFDPLDGSSNIDVNISIGTIFGIYKRLDVSKPPSIQDVLQPGVNLVAGGYTMYGSATTLVFTTGQGVQGFILDPSSGEFVLTHPNIKIKPKHSIYSINEGNAMYWLEPTKKYVDSIKFPQAPKKPYSHRYVGSMVADVHRTLIYGGIFMYPGDKNSKNGKLRLLYEANPMAMVMEQAGGKATTGTQRILEIQPTEVHQRVSVYLGSKEDVEELEAFYKADSSK
eukprot:TRINITY_DN12618_c0_g1_i1.p1 TRINITY_DN12618_c0_g1~~TRINITY_DN12618_c0_g1_i1.p1  ORF type:complete len:335 (-),score=57.86 TRINITY_DN12618_c0_g1_i1:66-1070(-)